MSEVELVEVRVGVVGMDWLHEVDKRQVCGIEVGKIGVIAIVEAALTDLHAIEVGEVEVDMSQVGAVDASEDGNPDLQNVAVVARSRQMGEFVEVIGVAQMGVIVTAIKRLTVHLGKPYCLNEVYILIEVDGEGRQVVNMSLASVWVEY
eukprot:GHVN01011474.1.p1 GENE.GHVN01011474.1~~GHVN01011474.1.p1  ORF type:complete len:161 (+),score=64.15 GHVN01011474.1:39-485(+)